MPIPPDSPAKAATPNPLGGWLDTLDADELTDLIVAAIEDVPGFGDWLDRQRLTDAPDPAALRDLVDRTLTPSRRFYEYRAANDYAHDAYDTVQLLAEVATEATPDLLPVIERAITLTTRAILKSDDSSGLQGDLVRTLLRAHAEAARTAHPALTQAEQTRLVTWIFTYRYSGKQDFFDPDIVAYAPALSPQSIERYRDAIAGIDLGSYGRYPLKRLAVLDADPDAIVAAHGGEPESAAIAARVVADLEEAGLHKDAVAYARVGIALRDSGWRSTLITFLVDDALARGADDEAVSLRREWLTRHPSSTSFADLKTTAEQVGRWHDEKDAAELRLAGHDPDAFVRYLLKEGQGEPAWTFARDNREHLTSAEVWLALCADRARTHPADTLPIYREIVTDTLTVTDVHAYQSAAKTLGLLRDAANAAGAPHPAEFDAFLAHTVEQNRRRPRCLQEFAKAKLISAR